MCETCLGEFCGIWGCNVYFSNMMSVGLTKGDLKDKKEVKINFYLG